MKIKIEGGCLDQFVLLAHSHRLFGQTIGITATGFDFHKNQIVLMLSNKINLPVTTEKIAFQDAITILHQFFSSQAFTSSAKSMTSHLFWRLCLPLLDATPLPNTSDIIITLYAPLCCTLRASITYPQDDCKRLPLHFREKCKLTTRDHLDAFHPTWPRNRGCCTRRWQWRSQCELPLAPSRTTRTRC